ncbi:MAG: hypothetical protein COV47_01330 [Candidatus Diapherotrites archaeon CG11_big_fil_rev_8_21_14_0_20_37_9]|nr:MAG: hypothetical protein COV47_01330 [Candidatus Diapherotrites archaeon CG11_big_fil_rev_8_21_14_0_20_37_9]
MSITVEDYTSKVLGVVKEKYGLNDKGDAVDKMADLFGEEFVEREVSEETIKELIEDSEKHIKKYGFKGTTVKQLRKEIEG